MPFDIWHICLTSLLLLKRKSHILAEGQCHKYHEQKCLGSCVCLGGQVTHHQLKCGQAAGKFPHPPLLLLVLKPFQHITSCKGRGRSSSNAGTCGIRLPSAPRCVPCWGLQLPGWQLRGCRTAERRLSWCKYRWCSPCCRTGPAALGQSLCLSGPGAQQTHSQEERSGACPTRRTGVGPARSWKPWPWLGLHTGGFPCVLMDFNNADWNRRIWTRRNKINRSNKRCKGLLAPLCPPQS